MLVRNMRGRGVLVGRLTFLRMVGITQGIRLLRRYCEENGDDLGAKVFLVEILACHGDGLF